MKQIVCSDCGEQLVELTGKKAIIDDGKKEIIEKFYCEEHYKKHLELNKKLYAKNESAGD